MPVKRELVSYTRLLADGTTEAVTELQYTPPIPRNEDDKWHTCPLCAQNFPEKQMVRYKGQYYDAICVQEKIEEDAK